MKMTLGAFLFLFILPLCVTFAGAEKPTGLRTDLLEQTDTVWLDGFPSNVRLSELSALIERYQVAAVRSAKPSFGWIVNDSRSDVVQTACRVQLSDCAELFTDGESEKSAKGAENALVWDTGKLETPESVNLIYSGEPLSPKTVYYWRVQTWNNWEPSPWSEVRGFKTANQLADYEISRYPIVKEQDRPLTQNRLDEKTYFYDFGRASFGQIRVEMTANKEDCVATIRLGERTRDGRVDREPFGTTRYASYTLKLLPGKQFYTIKTRVNTQNTTGEAFLVPDYIGEVMPFRYAEVEVHSPENVSVGDVFRHSAFYPFNESASYFHCDSQPLNDVWNLCRWSMKAASFLGVFIDGDRERIPYGGDALFQQMIHYGVDREYSLARYTQEYIIFHPTWPSECPMRAVQMAWFDYLYTGDTRNIAKYYEEFKTQSLLALAEENGLISTRKGKATREVLDSIHFQGKEIKDMVDWPWKGFREGVEGETDGFVFCDFNPVINAYHYFALRSLARFASILDKPEEAKFFDQRADLVYQSFQEVFFDKKRGVYKDGETTEHASLHANIFPMAMGLVPKENQPSVLAFIKSRGMVCSIFGAKFMLDSVYALEDGDYGLQLMLDDGLRGWRNMIRIGTTIIPEAWDDSLKPNLDWNHASGGAPGNIIAHKLVGVEPIEPGASKIRIKPQIGDLKEVDAIVPLIRGPVSVKIRQEAGRSFSLETILPANTQAEIWIPRIDSAALTVNGTPLSDTEFQPEMTENFYRFPNVGSGKWTFALK